MKKVCVLLATGFEETEALCPADILARSGCEVTLLKVDAGAPSGTENSLEATGSHGFTVKTDRTLSDFSAALSKDPALLPDAVLCPGGLPGATNIAASTNATELLKTMYQQGRLVAAICASPAVVLAPLGIVDGKNATCYPGMQKDTPATCTAKWTDAQAVTDGNVITGRGPGASFAFGYAVAEYLNGAGSTEQLQKGMCYAE